MEEATRETLNEATSMSALDPTSPALCKHANDQGHACKETQTPKKSILTTCRITSSSETRLLRYPGSPNRIISIWSNIHDDDTIEPSGSPAQQREGQWQHGSQRSRLRQSLVRWIIFVRQGLEERGCAARLLRRRGDQSETNWTMCIFRCMA